MKEVKETAVLFGARGDGRPHTFVITLTQLASRALRDAAVDHAVAKLLLVMVVRRFHSGGEHESKVVVG